MKNVINTLRAVLGKPPRPNKWFFETLTSPNSNTIRVLIYRHGSPYSSAKMTLTDDCKNWEEEKSRFEGMIKLIYADETR